MDNYPYITKNNLFQRQYYNYAVCNGSMFEGYAKSRSGIESVTEKDVQKQLHAFCRGELDGYYQAGTTVFVLREKLERLILSLQENAAAAELSVADKILKTFEVRKRLYHCYNEKMKPHDERDFEDLSLYVLFGCAMLLCYRKTNNLKYLNALLKVNDILLSVHEKVEEDEEMEHFFRFAIAGEWECVCRLRGER